MALKMKLLQLLPELLQHLLVLLHAFVLQPVPEREAQHVPVPGLLQELKDPV